MRRDHQQIVMMSDCIIEYDCDSIVLSGRPEAIHVEAAKILRRFAHTGKPFQIKSETPERMVLRWVWQDAGDAWG